MEQGGGTTFQGGQNSCPRRSPELLENSFSDKSAMAKRLELVLGPEDFETCVSNEREVRFIERNVDARVSNHMNVKEHCQANALRSALVALG